MGDASDTPPRASELLERWFAAEGAKTLGSLNDCFGRGAFAVAFVLLLAVPALPLPTGGATHVFEVIAMLLALQLVVGRQEVWLPERFRRRELAGERQQRFIERLMRLIRRLERLSRPRLRFLFHGRPSNVVFGLLVLAGTLGAFLAPPFTGLDTLPVARRGAAVARGDPRRRARGDRRCRGGSRRSGARDRAGQRRRARRERPVLTLGL